MYLKSLSIIVLAAIITTIACQKSTEPGNNYTGDVITYCYLDSYSTPQFKIYSINADGTDNKRLITANIDLNHMNWSPDGTKLAMTSYMDQINMTWSIHTVNADGTYLRRLTTTLNVWDSEPMWSPDGTRIAFERTFKNENDRTEIWVMNSDGSNQHTIGIIGSYPRWSIDGTKFLYTSHREGNEEIYICNSDGTNDLRLTNNTFNDFQPSWSHDGSKIVFVSNRENAGDLYTMNADGTGVMKLTNFNKAVIGIPRYSPDGTKISFNTDIDVARHYEVYVVNSDGSNVKRVTNSPGSTTSISPTWKPRR